MKELNDLAYILFDNIEYIGKNDFIVRDRNSVYHVYDKETLQEHIFEQGQVGIDSFAVNPDNSVSLSVYFHGKTKSRMGICKCIFCRL